MLTFSFFLLFFFSGRLNSFDLPSSIDDFSPSAFIFSLRSFVENFSGVPRENQRFFTSGGKSIESLAQTAEKFSGEKFVSTGPSKEKKNSKNFGDFASLKEFDPEKFQSCQFFDSIQRGIIEVRLAVHGGSEKLSDDWMKISTETTSEASVEEGKTNHEGENSSFDLTPESFIKSAERKFSSELSERVAELRLLIKQGETIRDALFLTTKRKKSDADEKKLQEIISMLKENEAAEEKIKNIENLLAIITILNKLEQKQKTAQYELN